MGESAARRPGPATERPHATGARPSGPLRWALRLPLAGPGQVRLPVARVAVYVLTAAGVVALAATAAGLLLSVYAGLFGYRESLAVPYARSSLVIEFAGAAVLLLAALTLAAAARGGAEPDR